MIDPLNGFDWTSLYRRYDSKCRGFNPSSEFLATLGPVRPESDRGLYYQLLNLFSEARRNSIIDPVGLYEALLYWKLYSQGTTKSNLNKWLRQDKHEREVVQESLIRLFQELPKSLERSPSTIVEWVKRLDRFQLPGMKYSDALPVRTTLLHFLYPASVPIFDQMVLRAVGAWSENANHKAEVLKEYLPFAWGLAEKYTKQVSSFTRESPIRVIDMALWVIRGNIA